MRYCWNVPGFVSLHERDLTIDVYQEAVVAICDLTDDSLRMALTSLKTLFPGTRADQLQQFYDLAAKERAMVFRRAQHSNNMWYVKEYLVAAALSTAANIGLRRHADTNNAKCLDLAPLHNDDAEGLFAHQSKAITDGKGGLNRSRGVGLCRASQTFELVVRAKAKRKRRFVKAVDRGKAQLSDWVEKHRDDEGFLNLFNEKHIAMQQRHQIIWDAQAARSRDMVHNRQKLQSRDANKLEAMLMSNKTLQSRHEKKSKHTTQCEIDPG